MPRKLTSEEKALAVAGAGAAVAGAGLAASSGSRDFGKKLATTISKIKPEDIARVAEAAGFIDPGARTLLALDTLIQSWTKALDASVDHLLKKLPPRETSEISIACEMEQAAIPVSQGLKAVHYGALRIVFRVLPRMIEQFLVKELGDFLGKVAVRITAHKLLGFIPFIGSALSTGVGVFNSVAFYNELEKQIHDVLGCEENKLDSKPMRLALNKLVKEMKDRVSEEPVRMKIVHTRKK